MQDRALGDDAAEADCQLSLFRASRPCAEPAHFQWLSEATAFQAVECSLLAFGGASSQRLVLPLLRQSAAA